MLHTRVEHYRSTRLSLSIVLLVSVYLLTYMADKANKTLSLDREVIRVLEQESNQSGKVNQLLRQEYDL